MSQPVKLSDELVLDARIAGAEQERSIAGQVEFWAKLGRALEPFLSIRKAMELRQAGRAKPLSEIMSSVDTPEGRARTKAYLAERPFPHYRPFPSIPRVYIRTDADGRDTEGRFVNRAFVTVDAKDLGGQSKPDIPLSFAPTAKPIKQRA